MKSFSVVKFATLSAFIGWCAPSTAGTFSCSGEVQSVAFHPTAGTLQVNTGHGVHYLCKIHESFNGVHPDICKAWYSMFLTAQASGREVRQYYNDSAGTSCSTLGNWVVPNPMPYYVELKK